MKKLTKKSLVFLGLFVTMLSYANFEINPIKEKEPKITNVSFKELKLGSMLSIKDLKGIVLYKESILKEGDYSKGFDLTSLPDGSYFFELDTEFEIVIIPFTVVSNQVAFSKEDKSTIFKPLVRVKGDRVYVSRMSFEKSPIEYKIYYKDSYDLVLSEEFQDIKDLKRIYDFSLAKEGSYLFVFKSDGRKFKKTIIIE